jgi:hypothetical protein
MLLRRFLCITIALTLSSILCWRIAPSFSKNDPDWKPVAQVAPAKLLQQLRQDYAPHIPPNQVVEVGQMKMLTLQQPGSFPLYLINTRVYPTGHPEQTPTCGVGGCLFLGYIPDKNGFKQVLNGWINDFEVQGEPPIIQPVQRVLNQVPCFQLTTYNPRAKRMNPTQILCFNGEEFVTAGEEPK